MPRANVTNGYHVELIDHENVDSIVAELPAQGGVVRFRARTAAGDFGLLLRCKDVFVGYTWASVRTFLGVENRSLFRLGDHEAYLFDTYVVPEQRSKGIGSLLRELMSDRLLELGRNVYYSFTYFTNTSARAHKRKLRAVPLELRLYVGLFRSRFFDVRVRAYASHVPTRRCYVFSSSAEG